MKKKTFQDLDFLNSKAKARVVCFLFYSVDAWEAQIARLTGLSSTAVSNALEKLIKEKLVIAEKAGWTQLYSLNRMEFEKRISIFKKVRDAV